MFKLSESAKLSIWVFIALAGLAHAHVGAFHPSMWCYNGSDPNASINAHDNAHESVIPLYKQPYANYWYRALNGCDKFPPNEGDFLEIPDGGSFEMDLASARGFTRWNIDPSQVLTNWADGGNYELNQGFNDSRCIRAPNLHCHNQTHAQGTAFSIAYTANLYDTTLNNTVIFTVAYHTPFHRVATYQVPSGMPECPEGGCICKYHWIPDGCGQPNIYIHPFRCKVIRGSTPAKTIGKPQAPVWCEEDQSKCVKGPKQPIIWNQAEGDNIEVDATLSLEGEWKSPAYNRKCGFSDGAQQDIFDPYTGQKRMVHRRGKNIH